MWLEGLMHVFRLQNALYMLGGTLYGLVIGALPGLGPVFGVASLIPLTYTLPPDTAILLLVAVHASTSFGDGYASILMNTPGGAGTYATCWDGFPLARKGKAGYALGLSAGGSLLGGVFGWLSMAAVAPILAAVALQVGPVEYTAILVLALSLVAVAARGRTVKGLILAGLGLLISSVGADPTLGFPRFTGHWMYLLDGVRPTSAMLGLFAVSQAFILAEQGGSIAEVKAPDDSIWNGIKGIVRYPVTLLRSAIVGNLVGLLPVLGITTGSVVAYLTEKRAAKDPEDFGKGDPRGLIAPETARAACIVGDLVPTFTLGIPGSNTTALFLAALMLHGIAPGRDFFTKEGTLAYTVFSGVLVAQFLFFFVGLALARYIAKVVGIPNSWVAPVILVLCFLGAYGSRNDMIDVVVMLVFGLVGYVLQKYDYPMVCMVLGIVLGPLLEGNFHRSLLIHQGNWAVFLTQPISAVVLGVTVLSLLSPYLGPAFRSIGRLCTRPPGVGTVA